MAEQSLVYIHDGITGEPLDLMPCASFTWARALSAQSEGQATLVFDGTHTPAQWRDLTEHWRRIVSLHRPDGKIEFIGYIVGDDFTDGEATKTVKLVDLWGLLARRGSWDRGVSNIAAWQVTEVGVRAAHAAQALIRARQTGPSNPNPDFPSNIPGQHGGSVFPRTYYGYQAEYVTDVWDDLMKEGLDIYLSPERQGSFPVDHNHLHVQWRFFGGEGWTTGVQHDYVMGVPECPITDFKQKRDSARVTNNALWVGEGSERDTLIRSARDLTSSLPALDRVSTAKNVSDVSRLDAMAAQDLREYGQATVEWSFKIHWSEAPNVGDVCRFYFFDHLEIPDGWHARRVVRVSGDLGELVTVTTQPSGGL